MVGLGKVLISLGVIIIVTGLLLTYNISIPYLGKLPGDISITGEKFQFYFPVVTCIFISIILSLLFYLFK